MSVNKLSASSKASLIKRSITAWVLVCILVPTSLFGNWPFFILVLFLSVVGIHEILVTPGARRYNWFVKGVVYVFVLSFIYWVFIKNMLRDPNDINYCNPFTNGGEFSLTNLFVSITGIILYALVLFLVAILDKKMQLQDVTYLFTMGIVLAIGFLGIYYVRYFPNSRGLVQNPNFRDVSIVVPWSDNQVALRNYFTDYYTSHHLNQDLASCLLIFFVCIGTWASDVGAYFVGMLFGKHRMNPRISPHKTWEGYFGGVVVSAVVSVALSLIMEFCFDIPLVPGILQWSYSPALAAMGIFNGQAWPLLVIVIVLLPFVGNVGGFLFSLIKRQYGIKDFGKIFPGHGGVIDRFDSILTNCIAISALISITAYGWSFVL